MQFQRGKKRHETWIRWTTQKSTKQPTDRPNWREWTWNDILLFFYITPRCTGPTLSYIQGWRGGEREKRERGKRGERERERESPALTASLLRCMDSVANGFSKRWPRSDSRWRPRDKNVCVFCFSKIQNTQAKTDKTYTNIFELWPRRIFMANGHFSNIRHWKICRQKLFSSHFIRKYD